MQFNGRDCVLRATIVRTHANPGVQFHLSSIGPQHSSSCPPFRGAKKNIYLPLIRFFASVDSRNTLTIHPVARETRGFILLDRDLILSFLPNRLISPSRSRRKEKYLFAKWSAERSRPRKKIAHARPAGINISSSSRCRPLAKKYFRLTHGSLAASYFNLPFFVDSACFASKHRAGPLYRFHYVRNNTDLRCTRIPPS